MLAVNRRKFIKQGLTLLGLLFSARVSEADRIADQLAKADFAETMSNLFKQQAIIDSPQIKLSLPQIAEDGAVVPITFSSALENIERIYILVEKNPTPLTAVFELSPTVEAFLSARIKMAESSDVIVIAQQGGQLLQCRQWVKVMQGGCGTG